MLENLTPIYKGALAVIGTGTIGIGATAPIDSAWIKVVVVLCGLITLMIGVMFTTLIHHLVRHGKEAEEIADNRIDTQSRLCVLKMKNIEDDVKNVQGQVNKIYRHVCPAEKEEN